MRLGLILAALLLAGCSDPETSEGPVSSQIDDLHAQLSSQQSEIEDLKRQNSDLRDSVDRLDSKVRQMNPGG